MSAPDETLRVGFAEVLDHASEKPEDTYARIMQKVDGWTSQLKPAKPPAAPTQPPSSSAGTKLRQDGTKSELTIGKEDPYLTLPWKQSQKKQTLATIHVTPELLQNPLARDLYDKVKEWKNLHVGHTTYRYSKMENGTEFLQKWSPIQLS